MDSLSEILLRLPGKQLCRLRTVSRAWQSLLTAPWFAAAHAARRREPYVVASYADAADLDRDSLVDVLDIPTADLGRSPAARATSRCYGCFRIDGGGDRCDLFEVCTLTGSGGAGWRGMQGPPSSFVWNEWTMVVVGGVVYLLSVAAYFAVLNRRDDAQWWIARFDLEAEQWRPSIDGPGGGGLVVDAVWHNSYLTDVTLANLKGSLVIVQGSARIMDLWFLKDSEEGIWMKQYSVQIERSGHISPMHPLLVLEDGRIVTVIRSMGLLQIYDPRTSTFASLMMLRHSSRVSVHTGSFLSLATW